MTRCEVVAVLPLVSVAVQITVLVPTGNEAGALLVTLMTEQLSETVGAVRMTLVALHEPRAANAFTLALVARNGAWVSLTMTRCSDVEVLPLESVAVQITVLVPTLN